MRGVRYWGTAALTCSALLAAGCNSALGIGDPTVRDSGESPDVSVGFDAGGDTSPSSNHDGSPGDAASLGDTSNSRDTSTVDASPPSPDVSNGTPADGSDEETGQARESGIGEGSVPESGPDAGGNDTSVIDPGTNDGAHVFGCGTPPCTPVVVLSRDAGFIPRYLAQDDTYLYWSQQTGGGMVGRTHKVTGETITFSQGTNGANGIATDDAGVFWVARPPDVVNRCPKSGCGAGPTQLVTEGRVPLGIALDENNVYWTDPLDLAVRRVAKTGGDGGATTLWQGDAGQPRQIATDGVRVYVTWDDGKLYVVGADGGLITSVSAPGATSTVGVTVDDRNVYWTDAVIIGSIFVASKTTLGPVPLASSQEMPSALVTDGSNIYWSNFGSGLGLTGSIMTCPIASCAAPTVLVTGILGPISLIVDQKSVYWADLAAIWKVDK